MIDAIYWENEAVVILDQNKLPGRVEYIRCEEHHALAHAIRILQVRGAPLIGVTAAYGLALAVIKYRGSRSDLKAYYDEAEQLFASTRPTAVNLFWAITRMRGVFDRLADQDVEQIGAALLNEAQAMFVEDQNINISIGNYGQTLLPKNARVLTICNAGALATCGYGTALGVIRSAQQQGKISQVWACETRPVLQGARLTVWELMQDNIPVKLITDSMAAYVMGQKELDAVIVGADRIAANGDTANKIGTYGLAVLAAYHQIPFYVAAPMSTVDLSISSGEQIPIEERNHDEVRRMRGEYITVPEVEVFNPAFDVTPQALIKAIITEKGIVTPPFFTK
ncbi:Methylthioribose-1-phosphate isomerase [Syntrophomonas zehnderi OL-4]|uniref:Methylthioribose-1-phosphate isomerase n=1 Tax=Syntrophomonas zehnderi OL-4 TaxID=690567 RepID=A0A0E4GCT2_9FIRM|nr:Methylthioribose-1-phosphate isomerase [Syntrophomonas zehnderi OL-4]